MNAQNLRVTATFGPETRFEVLPAPPAPFRAGEQTRFEQLKARLLREALGEVWEAEFNSSIRRAANDAEALAWITAYPLLVFPALFEEQVAATLFRAGRQEQIRERSRALLQAV